MIKILTKFVCELRETNSRLKHLHIIYVAHSKKKVDFVIK